MTSVLICLKITFKTCLQRLSLTLSVAITNVKYVAHLFGNYSFHTKKPSAD